MDVKAHTKTVVAVHIMSSKIDELSSDWLERTHGKVLSWSMRRQTLRPFSYEEPKKIGGGDLVYTTAHVASTRAYVHLWKHITMDTENKIPIQGYDMSRFTDAFSCVWHEIVNI